MFLEFNLLPLLFASIEKLKFARDSTFGLVLFSSFSFIGTEPFLLSVFLHLTNPRDFTVVSRCCNCGARSSRSFHFFRLFEQNAANRGAKSSCSLYFCVVI